MKLISISRNVILIAAATSGAMHLSSAEHDKNQFSKNESKGFTIADGGQGSGGSGGGGQLEGGNGSSGNKKP